eukprot:TRINITY_DN135_c1_g1_i11.p1 TRINITY_DN135_c1_g1~~TRINITY_DN135_c1_g1_i11.p1  ORF type:complete len:276 (-),score=35.69 TRINITY_DN135_c1_g1_i11:70-897(-)
MDETKQVPDKPVEQWTTTSVYWWAQKEVGLDEDDAQKLQQQKVDGAALLELTVESFERCGIPVGPASKLAKAVASLKGPATSTIGKYTYANQNRRCFVIEGATLSVGLKQFQADLLVDSGASFELELPFSKVVQFGLIETNSESGDAAFEKFTVHYLFPDVTVTLPTTDGKTISKNLTAVYGQAGENRPPKIRQTLEQQPPPANTTTSPVIQLSPIKQGSEKYELPTLGFLGLARLGLEINFRTNTLTLGKMIFKSHGYANRISTPIAKLDFGTK